MVQVQEQSRLEQCMLVAGCKVLDTNSATYKATFPVNVLLTMYQ